MLTLSEMRFVTQTSVFVRADTATGSRPTGTRNFIVGLPEVRSKTSSVPLGVFTAKSVVPSGDIARGRTWPLSNSTNGGPVDEAETVARFTANASARAPRAKAQRRAEKYAGRRMDLLMILSAWRFRLLRKKPGLVALFHDFGHGSHALRVRGGLGCGCVFVEACGQGLELGDFLSLVMRSFGLVHGGVQRGDPGGG